MKSKEFGARPWKDAFKGGGHAGDEFNRSFKKVRYTSAEEYACRNVKEYQHYPEMKDLTTEDKESQDNAKQSKKTENARNARQRMLQQVVGIAVGSTVIVTSYQARMAERISEQNAEAAAVVETVDTAELQEDDIIEAEDQETVDEEPADATDSGSDSGNGSGRGGRSGGRNGGTGGSGGSGRGGGRGGNSRGTAGASNGAESDSDADADADADENEQDLEGLDDEISENDDEGSEILPDTDEESDEDSENLPDSEEDNDDNSDDADSDEQDTDSSDSENSENDSAETPQEEQRKPRNDNLSFWEWNSDNTEAAFVIKTTSGSFVSSTPATVKAVEEPATCNSDGKMTYTATLTVGGETHTDVQYKVLPALGHSFGSGEEITIDGGKKAIRFECARCHEYFIIRNSISEE